MQTDKDGSLWHFEKSLERTTNRVQKERRTLQARIDAARRHRKSVCPLDSGAPLSLKAADHAGR